MLFLKTYAYAITGSAAILSDAAESVVHVFAVGFAAYSMWLSHKPADRDHTYGHDRIAFFSAGFEGAMILFAALYIIYEAIYKWMHGLEIENLDQGMLFVSIATALNGFLGFYLVRQGRKHHSLVLQADGKHILTDCLTSLGVITALVLTRWTGWLPFDPIIAILIGLNILWTSLRLLHRCVRGLMDHADPDVDRKVHQLLSEESKNLDFDFHRVRHRNAGNRLLIEVHLLFPDTLTLARAHELATNMESRIEKAFPLPTELVTHLEPRETHDQVHAELLGREG